MGSECFAPGSVVVAEGEEGDRLYLIVSGRAEVTVASAKGPVPVGLLGPGEIFGELALLPGVRLRQATVTAVTALETLTLGAEEFRALLGAHPQVEAALAASGELLLRIKFLKQATPFREIAPASLAELANRLRAERVPAGAVIVRQGDPGDTCYLVRTGRVEVVAESGHEVRRLALLGPGALFGEAALLTEAPRNATVRAVEESDLLALHRADLMAVLFEERGLAARLFELYRLRARPRRREGVLVYEREAAEGEPIVTLKEPRGGAYFRLSARGWFIWQRLDGSHSLRDLALEYFEVFGSFAPGPIAEVISQLGGAGFLEEAPVRRDVLEAWVSRRERLLRALRGLLTWRVLWDGVDPLVTRLYRNGAFLLYTRAAQFVLGAVAVAGFAAFAALSVRARALELGQVPMGALVGFLLPALLGAVLVHEAAHALTAKAFGCEVPRVGIGWYWIGPVAFIDASDTWLAPRRVRLAVSLAGPYATLILAGLAALAGTFVHRPTAVAALWLFALLSYAGVLVNLCPLLAYDGYYALSDLVGQPNLRARFLASVRQRLLGLRRDPGPGGPGGRPELLFAAVSLVYLLAITGLAILAYRRWTAL